MKDHYSIIIPIFNEISSIKNLINALSVYDHDGHEIIIVDDGSTDGSFSILKKCDFINLIRFDENKGKGIALRKGISKAKKEKIVLFDGDLELHPDEIKKIMILDEKNNINCVFGSRINLYPPFNIWDIGNLFLNTLFNLVHKSNVTDSLCCAKSFFKSDLDLKLLKSTKFDIDVEISSFLVDKFKKITNVSLHYKRRNNNQGKKLKMKDSLLILKRILIIL